MTILTDMSSTRAPAFKEWAVIVKALIEGEQVVDVRKGGIHEESRHFGLHATRLWLYPTYLHQRRDLLKPAYQTALDQLLARAPGEDVIEVPGWADVVGVAKLTDPAELETLDSKFIWTLDYAASRLKWKKRDPLWVLALRVHRLHEPITIPYREEYGGCTSWVGLEELPEDPTSVPSTPVLSDEAFEARLKGVEADLPGVLDEPRVIEPTG